MIAEETPKAKTITVELPVSATIIVSSAVLKMAVSRVKPFVTNNPILPVLSNVLLTLASDLLTVHASTLRQEMQVILPINFAIGSKLSEGQSMSVCVPATKLFSLLNTIPEQPISLVFQPEGGKEATGRLEIRTDEGAYTFNNLDRSVDYPKSMAHAFTTLTHFSLSVDSLKALMHQVQSYLCYDDLRPAMTGLYWEVNEERTKHELAATDGHRLIVLNPDLKNFPDAPFKTIISRDTVAALLKVLPKEGSNVKVEIAQANIRLSWGSNTIIARTIDERFPDYANVLNITPTSTIHVNRKALMPAAQRGLIFASGYTNQIAVELKGKMEKDCKLLVQAENMDYDEKMSESVPVWKTVLLNMPIRIGFNAKKLLECLRSINTPMVEFNFTHARGSVLLHPVTNDVVDTSVKIIVMPVMLND